MATIYRVGGNIYDATTGIKIPNAETLRANYSGAKEVAPPIQRDGAGFAVGTPPTPTAPLTSWNNYQSLKDAAQKILDMQTGQNKDLTDASNVWTGIQRSVGAFGAPQDPNMPSTGQFTDKDFQLMSPADQASVRLSRDAAAQAHLQGISQERTYRQNVNGTALQNVKDLYDANNTAADRAAQLAQDKWYKEQTLAQSANQDAVNTVNDKIAAGLPLTDKDYKTLGTTATNGKTGGTISWRNNNSGNLKFSNWETQYGATKDPNSAFAVFPDEASAQNAYKALLTSPTGIYKGLDNNAAMLKWSSEPGSPGYSYDKLVTLGAPAVSKPFSKFTDAEWTQFFGAQKKAEGWTEGTALNTGTNTKTPTQLSSAAQTLGVTATDLKTWSNDEIDSALASKRGSADLSIAGNAEGIRIQSLYGLTAEDIAGILQLSTSGTMTPEQLKAGLTAQGKNPAAIDDILKLNQPKTNTTNPFASV